MDENEKMDPSIIKALFDQGVSINDSPSILVENQLIRGFLVLAVDGDRN